MTLDLRHHSRSSCTPVRQVIVMRGIQIRKNISSSGPLMFRIKLLAQFISGLYGLSFQMLDVFQHGVYEFQEGLDQFAVINIGAFVPCGVIIPDHLPSPSSPDVWIPWRFRMETWPSIKTS